MIISRGNGVVADAKAPARAEARPATPKAANDAPAADFHLVHHRLVALERLSALFEKGALSEEEFAAEKALVLRLPAEELVLRSAMPPPAPRRPSLLGRLVDWKLLAVGTLAGLGLSFYSDPQGLLDLTERLGRLAV